MARASDDADGARATRVAWRPTVCSRCGFRIERLEHAYAAWIERHDGDECRTYLPAVVHGGDAYCGADVSADMRWILVEDFRRSPMDAVIVAMLAGDRDEASRLAWHAWVSIVLGLPFCRWDSIEQLRVHREVADYLPDRVPTWSEALDEVVAS